MATSYEWGVELIDVPGDDFDTDHFESYAAALRRFESAELPNAKIVLIRDVGNDDDGLQDRTWAYVTDGVLDEWCRDSMDSPVYRTPAKYIREVERVTNGAAALNGERQ